MEGRKLGKDRLLVPTEFTSAAVSRKVQDNLVPPLHFTPNAQPAGVPSGVPISGTPQAISWLKPSVTPGPSNPWLAISQAQQEIFELRRENQKIMKLHEDSTRASTPADRPSDMRTRSTDSCEQWFRREVEKHKAEAERLKGQVEALKETAERYRDELRDKDNTLNKQSRDLEAMRKDLCKVKTENSQIRDELCYSSTEKEKMSSQLDRLKRESGEKIANMRLDVERCKDEVQEVEMAAEMGRQQAEEEARKLFQQMEEMQKKQEVELQQLHVSLGAELGAAKKSNSELQSRLQSTTSEVLQLKSTLMGTSAERDELKEHLRQMEQAFETQSGSLHSLRNYIGQLIPEKGEREQLNEAVEKLTKEKAALQKTTELLTVRLQSVNEILGLQEEEILKKTSTDPFVKTGSEGLHVLHLWRDKVFKLCVQLRSKDIELREEKDNLLSKVRVMEQQLQQEQHRASVLQHTLDARIAELDLEKVEKESLKQDLAQAHKEKSQLNSKCHRAEAELRTQTETVQRFSLAFENKVAEVDVAQAKLSTFTQRLTFAKRRVETIQGLIMRRAALQKVQQAGRHAEQAADSSRSLQTELSLVCEERDKLTQELKRTPELIEKALADLKEQYESKLRQQQQDLEQSWVKVRQAVASREEEQQSLQQVLAQLAESKVNLEKLRSQLLRQQEDSERAQQQKGSEVEQRCAERLREMEAQVTVARREHTKAVMTLRHFEREAVKKHSGGAFTERDVQSKQLKEMESNKNPQLAPGAERQLMSPFTNTQNSSEPSERSRSVGAKPAADRRLFSVLEELHTLSAAVVNSSEDSAEEEEGEGEGQDDSVGPCS
ncbi:coiled-coil alpha-helical rod protein 1 [Aulostomus maculatus]